MLDNFYFENQGTMTYLVYKISEKDRVDTMSLGMLTNNKIQGLAPAIFTQMDETKYIKYNVSAKISVKQFFEGQVNKKRLLGVFNGIVVAMLSAEDYMIDTNTILLDLNYIFADVSTCETVLVCLPVEGKGSKVDLASFFKTIMFSTQFDQTENCDHVAKIINYLNSSPVFSLVDFKAVLDSIDSTVTLSKQPVVQPKVQIAPPVQQKPIQQPLGQMPPQQVVQQPIKEQQQPSNMSPQNHPKFQSVASSVQIPSVQHEVPTEQQISLFYLLQHYNKENKALYDAQKAAKKAAKSQSAAPVAPQQPQKRPQKTGFVVSNTPPNVGFAIPGQQTPPPSAGVNKPNVPPAPRPQTPAAPQPQNRPAAQSAAPVRQQPITQQPAQPAYVPPVSQGQSMNFGETTVLGGGKVGETTVLNGGMQQAPKITPHLIRNKNSEQIEINKPVFRIGKEKSYVDYFISDNTAVSRSHANIITREGQYFIVDTNSTNHTFVNAKMLQSNVEVEIKHGDKIRLGNEDFEFKLY